ncbi:MAG: LysM peptidoglycan-binding domain-containing protein [Mizugakiibacter sp.]|uniref:LysM peptidoglycan-binding domain-containing protein n=1 Tax=Mizugakiibacter sp. TaxID=1972610 RepID=UPI0031C4981B|nr:LysM peptidoglycan-binding domain-containing protein [Xanthomonadaceae bacterium]
MLKKALALLAGIGLTLTLYAATTTLRPDHPDTYVVKKGDTLWGISARFLTKPWLWPEIWDVNQKVRNPHLIYPGDVLVLGYAGGRARLGLQPQARAQATENAVPALPLSAIKPFLKDTRVLDRDSLVKAPYVVGFEEDQLRGTPGRFLYVRGISDAQPGQRYALVRPTHVFTSFDGSGNYRDQIADELDSNVEMYTGPWHQETLHDGHLGKGKPLGYEVTVIGTAEYLRGGDPATVLLSDSTMEIRKGDRLMPLDNTPYDAAFYPHAPAKVPDNLRVIAFSDAMDAVGPHQVVALSAGKDEGVENGQTYTLVHPGDDIHDDVISSSQRRSFGERVTLPEEFIGHAMVFRTFDHVSYALVMDSIKPVHLGDPARMPE